MRTVLGSKVLVSVVINCHNGARFLRDAIDSVYAQSHGDFEIVFLDNCSSDDSAAIAHSYDGRVRYYKSKNKTSLGKARHEALKKTRGKYITFLDCDDVWLENKLEIQINGLETTDYLFSYGGYHVINDVGKIRSSHRARHKSGFIFKNLLLQYEICMQSVMIDRKILSSNSMNFNKSFEYCPDYELFMRIASKYPIMVVDHFLTKYRVINNSLSSKTKHLAATEVRKSLENVLSPSHRSDPTFEVAISQAYAKATFYEALFNLSVNNKKHAVKLLRTICLIRLEYLLLFLILLFPISSSNTLWIIRR